MEKNKILLCIFYKKTLKDFRGSFGKVPFKVIFKLIRQFIMANSILNPFIKNSKYHKDSKNIKIINREYLGKSGIVK